MNIGNALSAGLSEGPIAVLGDWVEQTVTRLTGDATAGDLASLAVNLLGGNYVGAMEDGVEIFEDARMEAWESAPAQVADHPAADCPPPMRPATTQVQGGVSHPLYQPTAVLSAVEQLARDVAATVGHTAVPAPARVEEHLARPALARPGDAGWGHAPGAPVHARESLAAKLRQILGDPALSLEDKIALLFSELLEGIDDEIEQKMDGLQAKQAAKEAAEAAEDRPGRSVHARPANGAEPASASDISRLSSELQLLMQRRSQLQSLLSNVMSISHQSAMQTIANIR